MDQSRAADESGGAGCLANSCRGGRVAQPPARGRLGICPGREKRSVARDASAVQMSVDHHALDEPYQQDGGEYPVGKQPHHRTVRRQPGWFQAEPFHDHTWTGCGDPCDAWTREPVRRMCPSSTSVTSASGSTGSLAPACGIQAVPVQVHTCPPGSRGGWITAEDQASACRIQSETEHWRRGGARAHLVPGTAVPSPGGRRGVRNATADCEKGPCRGIDRHADHKKACREGARQLVYPAPVGPEPGLSGRSPISVDEDHLVVDAVPRHSPRPPADLPCRCRVLPRSCRPMPTCRRRRFQSRGLRRRA
jgi:hypothetical protein